MQHLEREHRSPLAFTATGHRVDIGVVVVTYDSAADVDGLLHSLRADVGTLTVRVVVVDNASSDGTVAAVRAHRDVVLHEAGGNLGYAAAINVGRRRLGDAAHVLVLNPDLVVRPGLLAALHSTLTTTGAHAAVPRIEDPDGATYPSLRREPSVPRALGDALRLHRLPGLSWLSELVRDRAAYDHPHRVDWATGAALMTTAASADAVGDWDERFFLYSEETDYLRRVRTAGGTTTYVPGAVAVHRVGGSGGPSQLFSLMAVNRVRYYAKHHGRAATASFRLVVALHHLVRAPRSPAHRRALRTVCSRASWSALPRGDRT